MVSEAGYVSFQLFAGFGFGQPGRTTATRFEWVQKVKFLASGVWVEPVLLPHFKYKYGSTTDI